MNDYAGLILAWLAGGALSAVFFGGLWWTVRRSLTARQPALWIFGSLLTRLSVVLPGFYFVAGGQWQRALTCLLGFLMARFILTWFAGQQAEPIALRMKRKDHAP